MEYLREVFATRKRRFILMTVVRHRHRGLGSTWFTRRYVARHCR